MCPKVSAMLIGLTPGLSCDDLSDEYMLEILDWAARDRIDKIAGWLHFQRWEVQRTRFSDIPHTDHYKNLLFV